MRAIPTDQTAIFIILSLLWTVMHPKLSHRYDWDRMENIVRKRLMHEKSGHDYAHVMRVLNNALTIAGNYKVDYDVLVASCLLHDIAPFPSKDHEARSAKASEKILSSMNFSKETTEKIRHAIIYHNLGFGKQLMPSKLSIEAKILCDADRLDAIGAIGIVRMVNFSTRKGIPMFNAVTDGLNETLYGNIKFMVKIGGRMFTPQAKIIAWQRLGIMKAFNNNLKAESISRR
jgi:uncharacterized protein